MIFAGYPGHWVAAGFVALAAGAMVLACVLRVERKAKIWPWVLGVLQVAAAVGLLLIIWDPSSPVMHEENVRNTVLVFFDTSESLSLKQNNGVDWLDASKELFQRNFRPGDPASPHYRIYGFDSACYPCDGLDALRKWGTRSDLHRPLAFCDQQVAAAEPAKGGEAVTAGGSKIVGAVILTDGQAEARQPAAYSVRKGMKLAIVGVGNERTDGDLSVTALRAPPRVALDTSYQVVATISRSGQMELPEGGAMAELLVDGSIVASRQVTAAMLAPSCSLSFDAAAAAAGEHSLTVRVSSPAADAVDANNTRSTVVQVDRPDELAVLLYCQVADSQVGKIRSALEQDEKIRLDVAMDVIKPADDSRISAGAGAAIPGCVQFPTDQAGMNRYDVIILGPCRKAGLSEAQMAELYKFVVDRGGGLVFLPGARGGELAEIADLRLRTLLPIELASGQEGQAARVSAPAAIELTLAGLDSGLLVPGDLELPHDEISAFGRGLAAKPAAAVLARSAGELLTCVHRVGRGRVAYVNANGLQGWYCGSEGGGVLARFMSGLIAGVGRITRQEGQLELFAERLADEPDKVRFEAMVCDGEMTPVEDAVVLLRVGEWTMGMESVGGGRYSADLAGVTSEALAASVEAEAGGAFLGQRKAAFSLPRPQGEMDRLGLDREFLRALSQRIGAEYLEADAIRPAACEIFPVFSKAEKVTDMISVWRTWPIVAGLCSLLTAIWFTRRCVGLA